jgi:hypothetical protein
VRPEKPAHGARIQRAHHDTATDRISREYDKGAFDKVAGGLEDERAELHSAADEDGQSTPGRIQASGATAKRLDGDRQISRVQRKVVDVNDKPLQLAEVLHEVKLRNPEINLDRAAARIVRILNGARELSLADSVDEVLEDAARMAAAPALRHEGSSVPSEHQVSSADAGQPGRGSSIVPDAAADKMRAHQRTIPLGQRDVGPAIFEVSHLLDERRTIKAGVPWSDQRKTTYRLLTATEGFVNITVGSVQIAADVATMGLAAPVTGAVGSVATSGLGQAKSHLRGGDAGERAAKSGATRGGKVAGKAVMKDIRGASAAADAAKEGGATAADGLGFAPIAGGVIKGVKGGKQLYDALMGVLPEGVDGNVQVLAEIKMCRGEVDRLIEDLTAIAREARSRKPSAAFDELLNVIAELRDFSDFLDRQVDKSLERFARDGIDLEPPKSLTAPAVAHEKHGASDPMKPANVAAVAASEKTSAKARKMLGLTAVGGQYTIEDLLKTGKSEIMSIKELQKVGGKTGYSMRARAKLGGSESTYQQICDLVTKHEALVKDKKSRSPIADGLNDHLQALLVNAQEIYALCRKWIAKHGKEKGQSRHDAVLTLVKQAKHESVGLRKRPHPPTT